MSLRVWLPLNGSLENKGLDSDIVFTNTNTSNIIVSNNGKIGKCYDRTTGQSRGVIASTTTVNYNEDVSMTCWAYISTVYGTVNGIITMHNHEANSGLGINVLKDDSGCVISCSTGNGTNRTYNAYYGTTNLINAWHHLALTYNKSKQQIKLYVDGNCECTVNDYNIYSINTKIHLFDWSVSFDSILYRPACKLNDVRIYDYALSSKEVKEIAKGLVLHYPMRQPNRAVNLIPDSSGFNSKYFALRATDSYYYAGINYAETNKELYRDYATGMIIPTVANDIFTVEFEAMGDNDNMNLVTYFYTGGNALRVFNVRNSEGNNRAVINGSNHVNLTRTWKKYWVTWCMNGADGEALANLIFRNFTNGSFTGTNNPLSSIIYVRNVKLIKGDSTCMSAYTPSGEDNTVEYDTSGYGYNGAVSNIGYSNQSRLGSGCYKFNTDTVFTHPVCFNVPTEQEWTVSAWVYPTEYNGDSDVILNTMNAFNYIRYDNSSRSLLYLNYGVNDYYVYGEGIPELNKWNHIIFTFKNSTGYRAIYLNGVKISMYAGPNRTSTPLGNSGGTIAVGGNFIGYMCDYRIYATALSEEDILELYNAPISIDKNGNLITQGEFKEEV